MNNIPFRNPCRPLLRFSSESLLSKGISDGHSRSGSALVLAIGVLALLAILAIAFVTLMRIEERIGRGSFELIQAKSLASAGLHYAIAILEKDLSDDKAANTPANPQLFDSLDEEWVSTFSGTDVDLDKNGAADSQWIYIRKTTSPASPIIGRFAILIQDEAGKINLNTAGPGNQNEGWTPYEVDLGAIPGIGSGSPAILRTRILNYRNGANTSPGAVISGPAPYYADDNNNNTALGGDGIDNNGTSGIDEMNEGENSPDEYDSEFPYSDDRPFSSVEELAGITGIGNTIVQAAKNYATVWSYDLNQYWDSTAWTRKINLNHLVSTGQLYGLNLIAASNLYRLAANIIDDSDRDIYPTFITSNKSSPSSSNSYLGLEGIQFNEIMTQTSPVTRQNDGNNVNRASAWPASTTLSGQDEGTEGQVGTWSWPWDNGTYTVRIYATTEAITPFIYTLESGEPGVRTGTITGSPTTDTVSISGGAINLQLTAPIDLVTAGTQKSFFDKIDIQAGKYIELINISQRSIPVDSSGGDAWRLYFAGTVSSPAADGLPSIVSGASYIPLSSANNAGANITLSGLNSSTSPPTYDYLIIADSVYALDALHDLTSDNGSWAGSGSEPGKLLVLPGLVANLNAGTDLILTDWKNNVIAYAPASTTKFNIVNYDPSTTTSYSSFSRMSPVNQQGAWSITTTGNPGTSNSGVVNSQSGTNNRYWSIKDRPFGSLGELGDVFLGTSNNGTYDIDLTTTSYGPSYFPKITLSAKRIEAEDADTSLPWSSSETASDSDGTIRYIAPSTSGSWTWNWTFDPVTTTSDITKPFRLPSNGTTFDLLVYGQFLYNFQSPSGTTRISKPNHGVSLNPVTVTNNRINFSLVATGVAPKLDYIVLTPEPYTWGRININTASKEVLEGLRGIGPSLADNIISYRQGNPFNQIEEITAVSGIGESTFKPIANLITVRSDVYRIIVQAQNIADLNSDGNISSNEIINTAKIDAIVDRTPSRRIPNSNDQYRIESLKYEY